MATTDLLICSKMGPKSCFKEWFRLKNLYNEASMHNFFSPSFLVWLLIGFCLWVDYIVVVSAARVESKPTQKCQGHCY